MDIIKISDLIEQKIQLLEKGRSLLNELAEHKSIATAEYDKALAKTMISIKNNLGLEFEGIKLMDVPATLIEKYAKGVVWQKRLDLDKSELNYKNAIVKLDCIKSELNGLQSMFRFLEDTKLTKAVKNKLGGKEL